MFESRKVNVNFRAPSAFDITNYRPALTKSA